MVLGLSDKTPICVLAPDICNSFGTIKSFHHVNPTLSAGEVLDFIGNNSAGNRTLREMLRGMVIFRPNQLFLAGKEGHTASASDARRQHVVQGLFSANRGILEVILPLAGLSTICGIAPLLSQAYPTPVDSDCPRSEMGCEDVFGISIRTTIAIAPLALCFVVFVFNQATLERYVSGVGTDAEAARRVDVNAWPTISLVRSLSRIAAALKPVIVSPRLGSRSLNAGIGFELGAFVAVLLGSAELFGGHDTMSGAPIGTFTVVVFADGLILPHFVLFPTPIVQGAIILVATCPNNRQFPKGYRSG